MEESVRDDLGDERGLVGGDAERGFISTSPYYLHREEDKDSLAARRGRMMRPINLGEEPSIDELMTNRGNSASIAQRRDIRMFKPATGTSEPSETGS